MSQPVRIGILVFIGFSLLFMACVIVIGIFGPDAPEAKVSHAILTPAPTPIPIIMSVPSAIRCSVVSESMVRVMSSSMSRPSAFLRVFHVSGSVYRTMTKNIDQSGGIT